MLPFNFAIFYLPFQIRRIKGTQIVKGISSTVWSIKSARIEMLKWLHPHGKCRQTFLQLGHRHTVRNMDASHSCKYINRMLSLAVWSRHLFSGLTGSTGDCKLPPRQVIQWKSAQRRRKHCALAVVRRSQNCCPTTDPIPGGAGWPKFNQLMTVITITRRPSLVRIDACNFELSW